MRSRSNTAQAFTLVEVLVSLVVVTIIGFVCWEAVNVLSPASQATILRIKAEHLITLSEEELHQYAQNPANYTAISGECPVAAGNVCDFPFPDVSAEFPPSVFTRTVTLVVADSNPNLKKFLISVTWTERGILQEQDSVILLAKPPLPLPGNIYGNVTDKNTGAALTGVQITAQNTINFSSNVSDSQAPPPAVGTDGGPMNYTFAQPGTGYYLLQSEEPYNLSAKLNGYYDYAFPASVALIPSESLRQDFVMTPKAADALITGSVSAAFSNNSDIELYENGAPATNVVASPANPTNSYSVMNSTVFSFDVSFNEDQKNRCFTLITRRAYQSDQESSFTCNGLPEGDGWSSAVADPSNNVINGCQNNWVGNSDSDQTICVTPGEKPPESPNIAISLTPSIPTATVTVLVQDSSNPPNPINASPDNPVWITVYWHDGTVFQCPPGVACPPSGPYGGNQAFTSSSDGAGHYVVTVPAEQSMDWDPSNANNGDHVQMFAQSGVVVYQCCNNSVLIHRLSQLQVLPQAVTSGSNTSVTLTIDTSSSQSPCGNANGQVIDGKTLGGLTDPNGNAENASVAISNPNAPQQTYGGDYSFQCPAGPPPYAVSAGEDGVNITANGYYPFTEGSKIYFQSGFANINPNENNQLPTIGLWPMGYGTVYGTVKDSVSGNKLAGIQVNLTLGLEACPATTTSVNPVDVTPCTATTDSNGYYEFDNVPETWPPPSLVNNDAYNQYAYYNSISVAQSGIYAAYNSGNFTLDAGDSQEEDVPLSREPGF